MRARSDSDTGLPQTNKNGQVTRKGKFGQKKFPRGNTTRNVKARTIKATKEDEEEEDTNNRCVGVFLNLIWLCKASLIRPRNVFFQPVFYFPYERRRRRRRRKKLPGLLCSLFTSVCLCVVVEANDE